MTISLEAAAPRNCLGEYTVDHGPLSHWPGTQATTRCISGRESQNQKGIEMQHFFTDCFNNQLSYIKRRMYLWTSVPHETLRL